MDSCCGARHILAPWHLGTRIGLSRLEVILEVSISKFPHSERKSATFDFALESLVRQFVFHGGLRSAFPLGVLVIPRAGDLTRYRLRLRQFAMPVAGSGGNVRRWLAVASKSVWLPASLACVLSPTAWISASMCWSRLGSYRSRPCSAIAVVIC